MSNRTWLRAITSLQCGRWQTGVEETTAPPLTQDPDISRATRTLERPTQARDVAQGVVTREPESQLGCPGVSVFVAPIETLADGAGDGMAVQQRIVDDPGPALAQCQASDNTLKL